MGEILRLGWIVLEDLGEVRNCVFGGMGKLLLAVCWLRI